MEKENLFLLHSLLMGAYLAFIYDVVRIIRRVIPHKAVCISLEDIVYWIYLSMKVFLLMYYESDGVLRWFAVGGALTGILVYKKLIGRFFVHYVSLLLQKILQRIRRFLKKRLKFEDKLLRIRLKKQ